MCRCRSRLKVSGIRIKKKGHFFKGGDATPEEMKKFTPQLTGRIRLSDQARKPLVSLSDRPEAHKEEASFRRRWA